MTRVLIGIQARSTSERLPGKALAALYNKPVLSWIVNTCSDCAQFITSKTRSRIQVDIAILCPVGDEISRFYKDIQIIEGDEHDVLSRYVRAQKLHESDYVVRITGDCPFLTSFQISNHIFKAVSNNLDYLSNVDPLVRTELEGRDIEILSENAIKWLDIYAQKCIDREHVTTKLRESKPANLKRGHFLSRIDLSDMKTSIDTEKDLEKANDLMLKFFKKKSLAEQDVGKEFVFYT
jgi:spore coat polysaccharide biosynthesis protein SpsF (cytidylyltransferase family)